MVVIALPLIAIAALSISASSSHRMFAFRSSPNENVSSLNEDVSVLNEDVSPQDASAIASVATREQLLIKSLIITIQHPVFGVGMGEFPAYLWGEASKKREWVAALGTHNSYTQVSSECGIPALVCYLGVIWLSIKRSYRLYRRSVGQPQLRAVEGLAFSLLMGLVVYAIGTFFFHIAYSNLLPLLSGQVAALNSSVGPALKAD
jgi:O-antigen ligase